MTKQEVLADESRFQRACSQFVGSNVHWCMSSLFYDIGLAAGVALYICLS